MAKMALPVEEQMERLAKGMDGKRLRHADQNVCREVQKNCIFHSLPLNKPALFS